MKVLLMTLGMLMTLACLWTWRVNAADPADEPENPGLMACQQYAAQHFKSENPDNFQSIKLLDEDLQEDKYESKVGSQFISTVLSGHGVWTGKDKTAPDNVQFTCLLENDKKPVFIHLVEDKERDPVDVCWDRFEPGEWGKMSQCLQTSLQEEETKLTGLLTNAEQQTHQSRDPVSARQTFEASNTEWQTYRDAECARRQAQVRGRNHPDVGELTCKIRKTRERISDMQFDD